MAIGVNCLYFDYVTEFQAVNFISVVTVVVNCLYFDYVTKFQALLMFYVLL